MLHQFHDILPGSSIHRVYAEAETALATAITETKELTRQAATSLIKDHGQDSASPGSLTVFNSLSWARTTIIALPNEHIEVTIPPCGWTTIKQDSPALSMPAIDGLAFGIGTAVPVRAEPGLLENEYLRARFDHRGELVSLVEKSSNWEVMDGIGNLFCLYKDVPSAWDAWDIDSIAELQPIDTSEPVHLEVLDPGPLMAQLRLTRSLSNSRITQVITLQRGSRRLEFFTSIDWQEQHKLLKVAFPINIHANEAIHEIQFGHLRRPTHRSRQYDADRFEVSNHKWTALADDQHGAAVLNDSKYGLSVDRSTIKLTLLKSAIAPDPHADRGRQSFTYAIYPWVGALAQSRVVQEAYELNVPPLILNGTAKEGSIFQISASNIILDTMKPAEDRSPDLILRLYESVHAATHCILTTSLPVQSATQTNMLEEDIKPLHIHQNKVELTFRPFEIKTIRLKLVDNDLTLSGNTA